MRTDRLVLRALRPGDATALAAYRDDPDVARYQDWELPYGGVEQAMALIDRQAVLPWPAPGEWAQVGVERDGRLVGDVGVGWAADGVRATIGFSLATADQGQGIGTEAVGAIVDRLFGEGVRRITATLDPANQASMRLLERLGFRYEGCNRGAALVRGEWCDDAIVGLLAADRSAWAERDRSRPESVELVEITDENASDVARLSTHRFQRSFVATVADSYADALFPDTDDGGGRTLPWMRAIIADGVLAGFVMVAEVTPTNPDPYLWRLLIDRWHQGRGIGRQVVEQLADRARAAGHHRLYTSYVEGRGSPAGFYTGLGFVPTGELDEDEVVAVLDLDS